MSEVDLFDSKPNISPTAQKVIDQLERVISYLDTLYEEGEDCIHPDSKLIVSDIEYDSMRAELQRLKPDSHIFKGVTASVLRTDVKKVVHNPPMTSISKANGTKQEKDEILAKWLQKISDNINFSNTKDMEKIEIGNQSFYFPKNHIVMGYKRDGVACSLYYKDGKLVKAGLRPRDGINGEDVTENILYVENVPKELAEKVTCSIRGELDIPISRFNQLNGTSTVENQEFANPRNYVAGSIRQFKNPLKTKSRKIRFVAYSAEALNNPPFKTEIDRAKWLNKMGVKCVYLQPFSIDGLADMENNVSNLDYEVDGTVISVNNLDEQEQLGRDGDNKTGNPKGKIAWKYADDIAEPLIESINWQVGRTGQISPVINVSEVKLAGTRVSKCSGYSLGYLVRNKVSVGQKVRIRKSGKIIPESIGFYDKPGRFYSKIEPSDLTDKDVLDFNIVPYPKVCPSCGEKTTIKEGQSLGMSELICENDCCPAQNVRRFVNYLQKFGAKGVGESTVEKLVEAGVIKSFADFYTLKVSDVFGVLGSKRISLLTVANIHMVDQPEQEKDNQLLAKVTIEAIKRKKKISLAQFISCLGISGASKGTGVQVSSYFKDFDKILSATIEDFEKAEDIGKKTANNLYQFFASNKEEMKQLLEHVELELPKIGKFTNKTFVFTGGLAGGKDKWKDIVENNGGKVSSSVSKKTDYVVIGSDPGQKADKAYDLVAQGAKINILDFNGLNTLLGL